MSVDWKTDTGYKRSTYDMESERKPYKPQKASANSTGFTSQIAAMATDGIMEQAVKDRMALAEQEAAGEFNAKDYDGEGQDQAGEEAREGDQDKDGAKGDEDDTLEALRARRRKQMKDEQEKRQKNAVLGHGSYDEIAEDEFLKTVTSSHLAVVHFYHRNFERCKIIDMHLSKCCKRFFNTRFVKLDAEKAHFFVDKLKVKTLPCCVVFVDGVAKGRQVGFDGLGADDFTSVQLAWRLKEWGGIDEDFGPEDEF